MRIHVYSPGSLRVKISCASLSHGSERIRMPHQAGAGRGSLRQRQLDRYMYGVIYEDAKFGSRKRPSFQRSGCYLFHLYVAVSPCCAALVVTLRRHLRVCQGTSSGAFFRAGEAHRTFHPPRSSPLCYSLKSCTRGRCSHSLRKIRPSVELRNATERNITRWRQSTTVPMA